MVIDLNHQEISTFLKALGYKEGEKAALRFFYPKNDPRSDKDKGRKCNVTLKKGWLTPVADNQKAGRGAYLVVNKGGALDSQIKKCIAIFCEWDDLDKSIQINLWQTLCLPEPTIQVDTGGKSIHCYWVLESPVSVEEWKPLQSDLLEYADADRKLKNPSRVMRLPGAYHMSHGKEPVLSKIISLSGIYYSFDLLRDLIPETKTNHNHSSWVEFDKAFQLPISEPVPLLSCTAKKTRLFVEQGVSSGRNCTAAQVSRDLIGTESYLKSVQQPFVGNASDLFFMFCQRCDPDDWNRSEWDQVWKSAESDKPGPSLSPEQIENCIKGFAWNLAKNNKFQIETKAVNFKDKNDPWAETETKKEKKEPNIVRLHKLINKNLGGRLAWNTMSETVEVDGLSANLDDLRVELSVSKNLNLNPRSDFESVVQYIAKYERVYSPVVEYLDSCYGGHQPKSREEAEQTISEVLTRSLPVQCDDAATLIFYNTFIQRWLVGCVSRAYEPGTQVDYTLVLQGGEGVRKSSFFRCLGGEWHLDSLGDIKDKDTFLKAAKAWIIEWGELETLTGKKEISRVKEFLTSTTDMVRKPYGRVTEQRPRTYVFCGTTNNRSFINDDTNTGARRFLVIGWIKDEIDTDWLHANRDRIWGAAVFLYKAGDRCNFDLEEIKMISNFNKLHQLEDPLTTTVKNWVGRNNGSPFTSHEAMTGCRFEPRDMNRALEMRFASILREMGYEKKLRRIGGIRARYWEKTTIDDLERQYELSGD